MTLLKVNNVTVRQLENDIVEVAMIDPLMMMGVINNPALKPIAVEARARGPILEELRQYV